MYLGHKNWNHWNVALWLFNDEGLYRLMVEEVRASSTKDIAAKDILYYLPRHTPDGAPYTYTSVRAALVEWED